MAFNLIELSPDLRERIEADLRELRRLHRLQPRWLARYLVTAARQMRTQCRWGPFDPVYDATLLWQLVPELAFRLGETRFKADERADPEIVSLDDRSLAGHCLSAIRQMPSSTYELIYASRAFLNRTPHGNAVQYGLAHLAGTPYG